MSTQNLNTASLGSSSRKAKMHKHFWAYQHAIASNNALETAKIIGQASAEDSKASAEFYALYTGDNIQVPSDRQGKGNGRKASHPYFSMVEIETESVNLVREKAKGKGTLRSKVVDTIREEVKAQNLLMYGKYSLQPSPIADSPNNVSFWEKCWHAYALYHTGALDKQDFVDFKSAAKLDKRTLIAEIAENWRTLSPSMMLAKHTSDTESRQAKTGKRTTRKSEETESTAETVTA